MKDYRLTKRDRRVLCVHEAGHAVIHAIGGNRVFRLTVAPLGDDGTGAILGRDGEVLRNVWGNCASSSADICHGEMQWNSVLSRWVCNRSAYVARLRHQAHLLPPAHRRAFLAEQRRILRAHLCARLAGELAERIVTRRSTLTCDLYDGTDEESQQGDDVLVATAYADLLPYQDEFRHACQSTADVLRRPKVWQHVLAVARTLERVGDLREDDLKLPPPEKGWPPSPVSRGKHRAQHNG